MEPRLKAIELYNKMYETGFKPKSVLLRIEQAKECALIAVDEILWLDSGDVIDTDYWLQVKQEIEKL
jgi:hypothetical protein